MQLGSNLQSRAKNKYKSFKDSTIDNLLTKKNKFIKVEESKEGYKCLAYVLCEKDDMTPLADI